MLIPTIIQTHSQKKYMLEVEELCTRFLQVAPTLRDNEIYLPLNVPSSKNSRSSGFDNPLVTRFYRKMAPFILYQRDKFRNKILKISSNPFPVLLTYQFHRSTKRAYDYGNAIETVNDLLDGKKYFNRKGLRKNDTWIAPTYRERLLSVGDMSVIPDDDTKHVIPVPDPRGAHIHTSQATQGVIVAAWDRKYWLEMFDDKFEF